MDEDILSQAERLSTTILHTREKLQTEIQQFETMKQQFESTYKKIDKDCLPPRIKVNIGGTHFESSRENWLRYPDSYFGVKFTRWDELPEDGVYFIDRDPTMFPFVLNFLRGVPLHLDVLSGYQLEWLIEEADYYVLPELVDMARGRERDWTLLMKSDPSDIFQYHSIYWTENNTFNLSGDKHDFSPMKTDEFNTLEINELLIETDEGRSVTLVLDHSTTLLALCSRDRFAHLHLHPQSEPLTPTTLIIGREYEFYDEPWRLNSQSPNGGVRIGGWYRATWPDDIYGVDQSGMKASAECAGIGINITSWEPRVHATKSCGIRSAHDSLKNGGNTSIGFKLYGRHT